MSDLTVIGALFMQASRDAFRYPSPNGELTTEQLWNLPLTSTRAHQASLDDVARGVYDELQAVTERSFVNTKPNPKKPILEAKLEIVKAIITVKQAENAEKVAKQAAASEAAKLEAILDTKKAADLQNLPTEEIEKRLAEAKAKANA
jgi:hypothetical protein